MIVLDGLTKVYDGAEVVVNSKTEASGTWMPNLLYKK
jgi:hypothetical protein